MVVCEITRPRSRSSCVTHSCHLQNSGCSWRLARAELGTMKMRHSIAVSWATKAVARVVTLRWYGSSSSYEELPVRLPGFRGAYMDVVVVVVVLAFLILRACGRQSQSEHASLEKPF